MGYGLQHWVCLQGINFDDFDDDFDEDFDDDNDYHKQSDKMWDMVSSTDGDDDGGDDDEGMLTLVSPNLLSSAQGWDLKGIHEERLVKMMRSPIMMMMMMMVMIKIWWS